MEEKLYLFSYGTLKNKKLQRILLGAELNMQEAVLDDWRLYADNVDQYYFLKEEKGYKVNGVVLELTKEQFWILDQWEEVPSYTLKKVNVKCGNRVVKDVYVYLRMEREGTPVSNPCLSGNPFKEDEKTAKDHRQDLDSIDHLPYSDYYLLLPCYIEKGQFLDEGTPNSFWKKFLNLYEQIIINEFNLKYTADLSRKWLRELELGIFYDDPKDEGTGLKLIQNIKCNVYVTQHIDTNLSVITIAVPVAVLAVFHTLDALNQGILKVFDSETDDYLSLYDWLSANGVKIYGKPRSAIFSQKEIDEINMLRLVMGEYELLGSVTEKKFRDMIETNLAQYDTAKIYCSDTTLIEISSEFEHDYLKRIDNQILTLFVIELLLFQDAAISKVADNIDREIAAQLKDPSRKNSLDIIEELVSESTRSLLYWNPRNFKYPAAESLANRISSAFGIEKMLNLQEKNKSKLEQLINIHYVKMTEQETKNTNLLLLILAMIQVIPTFYAIFSSIINKELNISNYLSSVISLISVIIIYLIFQRNDTRTKQIRNFSRSSE